MKNLSTWRTVRLWEQGFERDLRQRHRLWLHGLGIGSVVLSVMWATAHVQMVLGSQSLALRYLVTLGVGYLAYLLLVRLWAAALIRPEKADTYSGVDLPGSGSGSGSSAGSGSGESPGGQVYKPGGGGDFAGAGASGDFHASTEVAGNAAAEVMGAAASADEGAIVAVPVLAVFAMACLVLLGAGSLLLLYFGWEVLLAATVELAFSYVSARTAIRVVREGWLSAVVRLTWKPLLGAVACAVLLGASIDYFAPSARSLPHAIQLLR